MIFGSFCSGIEAASVAWGPLGWRAAFVSEIEPFPCAVLRHHYPDVPNLGDMTKVDPSEWKGKIDVLVAGTPCQAFSVAGLRKSLDDDRGNLTLKFVELVHGIDPAVVVWENVPGVLSTKDNAFGCFLGGLVGAEQPLTSGRRAGSWPRSGMVAGPERTAAWRVLDAQYLGLAQRRRRVFVVSLRTRDGGNPGAILFEPESVPRDTPPSRETGARVTGCLASRARGGGGLRTDFETDGGLTTGTLTAIYAKQGHNGMVEMENGILPVTHALRADGFDASEDGTGRGTPIIPIDMRQASRGGTMTNNRSDDVCSGGAPGTGIGKPGDPAPSLSRSHPPAIAFDTAQITINVNRTRAEPGLPTSTLSARGTMHVAYGVEPIAFTCKDSGGDATEDLSPTLRAMPPDATHANGGGQVAITVRTDQTGSNGLGVCMDVAQTLDRANGQAVMGCDLRNMTHTGEIGHTLQAKGTPGYSLANTPSVQTGMAVRRLTPLECERLQGFPDCYTRIPLDRKTRKEVHDDFAEYLRKQHAATYPDAPPLTDDQIRVLAADGPRYRGLGNSFAVPVVRWIGERIQKFMAAGC